MKAPPLRYASYHLHVISLLTYQHRAGLTLRDQIALVQAFDSALDLLESEPTCQSVTVAGGCAVLEDYLRLRPEQFERLETAVRRRALLINPFYVSLEPSLHTPEGVIRNLLRGTASAAIFGGALSVALCLGAHGLPAWLPQVLRGFNLQALLADSYLIQPLEQRWEGDDGSQTLLVATHSPLAPDEALESAYQRMAPHCQSGHFMLPYQWQAQPSAKAWRMWFAGLQRQRPMDIVLHSTPEAYIRAAQSRLDHDSAPLRGDLTLTERSRPPFDIFIAFERFLTQSLEPLIALAASQDSPCVPRQPQRLIDQLWQLIFDWANAPLADAQQALEAHLKNLEREAEILAHECGTDLSRSPFERLIRADNAQFELTACKLPADPTRSGLIVRGRLSAPESAWIALRPWRPFACCEVVSLAEVSTGGNLAVEADGTVHFRAEPQHLYTFWLHD
jgi:hypothetical protein